MRSITTGGFCDREFGMSTGSRRLRFDDIEGSVVVPGECGEAGRGTKARLEAFHS